MKVAELMKTDMRTISIDATLGDAVDALTEAQVSAMPVVDRLGRAVGVVSARDILRAESTFAGSQPRESRFDQIKVLEIMAPWPPTITPDTDVKQAAQDMLYFDAQRLFVEDRGSLVGVISQTDIVGAVARAKVVNP
ncbi:MAG TPA: CBS domain-containing protein [Gemmatimonadales bacterium]|nr:CBS domain-containing protein [Gemmatimonadales bacterium]